MRVYNSLTRKKEEFKTLTDGDVKMYACGITVSKDAHIGHAIQAIVFDVIRTYLQKKGYRVIYARNYTDVDDKIIAMAKEKGVPAMGYANALIEKTDKEMELLGVKPATYTMRATEYIDQIIEFVQKLIDKGYAYSTPEGDVYFRVKMFKEYGKLSNRTLDDALEGVRIDNEPNKETPYDFALWKSAKPGEIFWESPWGKGRPGWHIECSAMNYYGLGEQIDIHGGGRDLIFPHHENEIAQTESLTGKEFAKYWLHNGLVKVNGQKMSKSLNNSILIEDILAKYHREVIRFALLQTNYKNDINITDDLFENSKKHMLYFYNTFAKAKETFGTIDAPRVFHTEIENKFDEAMDDDFNTAQALGELFEIFKNLNAKIRNKDESAVQDIATVRYVYGLFGIFGEEPEEFLKANEEKIDIPENIKQLAEKRWKAKKEKDFLTSDSLRTEIQNQGYDILDSKDGFEIIKL